MGREEKEEWAEELENERKETSKWAWREEKEDKGLWNSSCTGKDV